MVAARPKTFARPAMSELRQRVISLKKEVGGGQRECVATAHFH